MTSLKPFLKVLGFFVSNHQALQQGAMSPFALRHPQKKLKCPQAETKPTAADGFAILAHGS